MAVERASSNPIGTATSMDRLDLLIVSQDSGLVGLLRTMLRDIGLAGRYLPMDVRSVSEVLRSRHFDGIILDCKNVGRAKQILGRIRQEPSNRQCPVVAVIHDAADTQIFQTAGANFCVCQPISPDHLKSQLSGAFDAIQKEHRRYLRYAVNMTLSVGTEKDRFISARLINVSAEGMAVLLSDSVRPQGAVRLRFDLPSIDPYRVEATGNVIWTDGEGRAGIKLLHMPSEARRRFRQWLEVLHGQFEFRRLTEKDSQASP